MAFLDFISSIGNTLPSLFSSPAFGQGGGEAPSADVTSPSTAGTPGLFDRLNAGVMGLANSGAPVPAVGNLIGGLITGQRTDPAGIMQRLLAQRPGSAPDTTPPGIPGLHSPSKTGVNALLDRLNAGVMGFANAGAPVPAVANLFGGLITGQRTDPAGIMQRLLALRQPRPDQAPGAAPDQGRGQAPPIMPPIVPPTVPGPVRTVPPAATFNDGFNAVYAGAGPWAQVPPLAAISALRAYPGLTNDFIAKYGPRF